MCQRLRDFKNILSQVGPCRGYFPRWYYDASMQMCLQFIYGGCRGNSNNFDDYEDCMRLCETNSRAQEGESLEAAALTAAAGEGEHQNDQGDLVMVFNDCVQCPVGSDMMIASLSLKGSSIFKIYTTDSIRGTEPVLQTQNHESIAQFCTVN